MFQVDLDVTNLSASGTDSLVVDISFDIMADRNMEERIKTGR